MTAYKCIVSDPPWDFSDKLPGKGRGAEKYYKTLSVDELSHLRLPIIANDAHLFMWRVAAMQREALDVIRMWGFTVKSELVWVKKTINDKQHMGMGRHVRMSHEICLICTKGKGAGILNHSTRSVFEAPVGRHSEKPDKFYEIVESLVPGPRLELFARKQRIGWHCIGDQLTENPSTLSVAL